MTAVEKLHRNGVDVDFNKLVHLAHQYSVTEISVFGSSIRSDMKPESDIDLLITFSPSAAISLFDLMDLENALEQLFNRHVDIVEPQALTNPVRRKRILSSKELLYAS